MYTFKVIDMDNKSHIRQERDEHISDSPYPDPYLYFASNNVLWANHKDDITNVIDWEWIKTDEELT